MDLVATLQLNGVPHQIFATEHLTRNPKATVDAELRGGTAVPKVEYAVDVWDLSGTDGRPNTFLLHEHLREFGAEGWELVSLTFNVDLDPNGPSHLLVFKRFTV